MLKSVLLLDYHEWGIIVKNKRNRQIGKSMAVLLCAAMLLGGCGQVGAPENVDITSVVISAKGSVQSYLVEEFDKDY